MMSMVLLLTVSVGEVAVGYGLEIPIDWAAFLATLDMLSNAQFL